MNRENKSCGILSKKEIKKYPSPRIELVKRIGSFDQPVTSHKIEWSRRDNRPVKSTMAVERAPEGTTMIVVDAGVFNVDDLIEIVSADRTTREQLIVDAVSGGGRDHAGVQRARLADHRAAPLAPPVLGDLQILGIRPDCDPAAICGGGASAVTPPGRRAQAKRPSTGKAYAAGRA